MRLLRRLKNISQSKSNKKTEVKTSVFFCVKIDLKQEKIRNKNIK